MSQTLFKQFIRYNQKKDISTCLGFKKSNPFF